MLEQWFKTQLPISLIAGVNKENLESWNRPQKDHDQKSFKNYFWFMIYDFDLVSLLIKYYTSYFRHTGINVVELSLNLCWQKPNFNSKNQIKC